MTVPRQVSDPARGFTSVELLFGLILIVISASLLIAHAALRYARDTTERNRVFAFMAAKSVLAEIQAAASAGQDLRRFDDGGELHPTLSLSREIVATGDADASADGNFRSAGEWVWWRGVEVLPVIGVEDSALRTVTVTVAKRRVDGRRTEVASMSAAVSVPAVGFPTTQVFDLYLLAIENIDASGIDLASIRPLVEAEITDFERRNPGLALRTHWITKASYGRDPDYVPSIGTPPGRRAYHYDLDPARAAAITGRVSVDGVSRNDFEPNTDAFPYTLADGFNTGMRLPRERQLHEARVGQVRDRKRAIAEAKDRGAPIPDDLPDMSEEPTLRLLLEDLNTSPETYRDALILNLHGDVLPMPAIRNYSDAAADPAALPDLRCVTHPERLRSRRDPTGHFHDPVVLRVYAWSDDPAAVREPGVCPEDHGIALRVMDLDLTDPAHRGVLRPEVTLECLAGGVPLVGPGPRANVDRDYRPFAPAKDIYQHRDRNEMFYFAQFVDPGFDERKYTLLWLFHTPVTCPPVRNSGSSTADRQAERGGPAPPTDRTPITELPQPARGPRVCVQRPDPNAGAVQGLDPKDRLYGLEYLPAPLGRDLAAPGRGPKNTARWRLTLTGPLLQRKCFVTPRGEYHAPAGDVRVDVSTSFWKLGYPLPARISTTYAWWSAGPEAVPATERAQFLGDPRHLPYADAMRGDGDFAGGYNPAFGVPRELQGYPMLDSERLRRGGFGPHHFDVPRYLALLRDGLLRSRAVFATLGTLGPTRVRLGGEAADDRERLVRRNPPRASWWCRPWLGELRPDDLFARRSNLPLGSGPEAFSTVRAVELLANHVHREPAPVGPRSLWQVFFNAELSEQAFAPGGTPGAARLTETGRALARHYRTGAPESLPALGTCAWQPVVPTPDWDLAPYRTTRCRARPARASYTGVGSDPALPAGLAAGLADGLVAGLVELACGREHTRVVVDRLQGDVRGRLRRILRTLVDARTAGGDDLPPRVHLLDPAGVEPLVEPKSITLRWETRAERWDGGGYEPVPSPGAPPGAPTGAPLGAPPGAPPGAPTGAPLGAAREAELSYLVLYSRDAGRSWRYALDHAPAVPGRRPEERYLFSDRGAGPEQWLCPTPVETFPAGEYLWRVEAYLPGRAGHGAHHQRRIEIVR